MAADDPYSPCPCGSGQKFKWCCQKVEAHAERAQRLFQRGQVDAAIHAVDEGLRKEPSSPLLLMRKAMYHVALERLEPAKALLRQLVAKMPQHAGAQMLLTQLVAETEGFSAGVAQLQHALAHVEETNRVYLSSAASMLAVGLAQRGDVPAALRHLLLSLALTDGEGPATQIRRLEQSRMISPWLRNPYWLEPAPPELSGEPRERFEQALGWADEGRWSSAASAFEVLSAGSGPAVAAAERNAGLCRLWIADREGAATALRRSIARLGVTDEAVDLEALCQEIAPPGPDDVVERVELSWPLRDRQRLLAALRADRSIGEDDIGEEDDDEGSPAAAQFVLLDRPRLERVEGLSPDDIPAIVGHVFVADETAGIETFDDGRLDGLVERFTELAQGAIPPAHPKTRVLGKFSRTDLTLSWQWHWPEGVSDDERLRLERERGKRLFEEIWPNTPLPFLKGRTPLEAARAGDAVVPLRAALFLQERSPNQRDTAIDLAAVRARLGLAPEPEVDPATVDIEQVHVARLALVPADRLDDEQLADLYRRARRFGVDDAAEAAARVLVERPQALKAQQIDPMIVYGDLAQFAAARSRTAEAFEWVARGRRAESPEDQQNRAALWDTVELRIRARTQRPEEWVPQLAVLLERHGGNKGANEVLTLTLMELGLLRVVPKPDDPDDFMLDSRPLQLVLSRFGPRVTTASGTLGVSATGSGIWTPGSGAAGGGSSGLWTPGAEAGPAPGGESKPKLIIPGR